MSPQHGQDTIVKVGANDMTPFTDNSELEETGATHAYTPYGNKAERHARGIASGKFTMNGTHDTTAGTGPKAVLQPLVRGPAVVIIRQIEGAGDGLPQDSFSALCTSYKETSPAADMVKWSADFQIDGEVDHTPQVVP